MMMTGTTFNIQYCKYSTQKPFTILETRYRGSNNAFVLFKFLQDLYIEF